MHDVADAHIPIIGFLGFVLERLVFGSTERATVQRRAMVRVTKG